MDNTKTFFLSRKVIKTNITNLKTCLKKIHNRLSQAVLLRTSVVKLFCCFEEGVYSRTVVHVANLKLWVKLRLAFTMIQNIVVIQKLRKDLPSS